MGFGSPVVVHSGCDVQGVASVEAALSRWGSRYVDRVYTSAEQAACRAGGAASFAGRFAAKEAVLKLCGRPDGIDPRWVEIASDAVGRPQVRLHHDAATHAEAHGLGEIHVSIAQDCGVAIAVAVAPTRPLEHTAEGSTEHAAPIHARSSRGSVRQG